MFSSVISSVVLPLSLLNLVQAQVSPRENILSRSRRFVFPDTNAWTAEVTLLLTIPIGPLGADLLLELPITFNLGTSPATKRSRSDSGFLLESLTPLRSGSVFWALLRHVLGATHPADSSRADFKAAGAVFGAANIIYGNLDYTFNESNQVRKRRNTRSQRSRESINLNSNAFHEEKRCELIRTFEDYVSSFGFMDGHPCMLRALCEMAQVPLHSNGFMGDLMNMMLTPAHIVDAMAQEPSTPNEYVQAQITGRRWDDCSRYHAHCPVSLFEFGESNLFNYGFHGNQTSTKNSWL